MRGTIYLNIDSNWIEPYLSVSHEKQMHLYEGEKMTTIWIL